MEVGKITRQQVAQKLTDYLLNRITLAELVDWAEQVIMDGDFAEQDLSLLRDIVSQIGLADVQAFGLTWENCQNFLSRLGYQAQITIFEVA